MHSAHRRKNWILMPVAAVALATLTPMIGGCASTATAPTSEVDEAALPRQVHWVRNSAEYRAVYAQTFRLAGEVLEGRVRAREPGSWAVAIDADETLISNSEQSKSQALGASGTFEEQWDVWVRREEAPALPGAAEFLDRVHGLGGRIAVVTNRRERHCEATEANLRALELPFDVILCRGDTGDKNPRWRRVQEGTTGAELPPLEIVMWIGDNIHDFPGLDQELRYASEESFADFGERFFILPNPLYGSWEGNAPN